MKNTEKTNLGDTWDLTKPLSAKDLDGLSLEELQDIRHTLCERAVEICVEHEDLISPNPTYSHSLSRRTAEDENGRKVFEYGSDWGDSKDNFFTPGKWWAKEVARMEKERKEYEQNKRDFPQAESKRIIDTLCVV